MKEEELAKRSRNASVHQLLLAMVLVASVFLVTKNLALALIASMFLVTELLVKVLVLAMVLMEMALNI